MEMSDKKTGKPIVKAERSFREIVENFTDPREVIREAISNSLDWSASIIRIIIYEDATRADRELVIKIWDNGLGLTRERFSAFWNLADSPGLQKDKFGRKLGGRIGEKGHGTKTFWKCRQIEVESIAREEDGSNWHILGEMKEPINTLIQDKKVPDYEYVETPGQGQETFTEVTIRGYHTHSNEDFRHETLKDYIQWFTKFGSIELELQIKNNEGKVIELQGLGRTDPETLEFARLTKDFGDFDKFFVWQDFGILLLASSRGLSYVLEKHPELVNKIVGVKQKLEAATSLAQKTISIVEQHYRNLVETDESASPE